MRTFAGAVIIAAVLAAAGCGGDDNRVDGEVEAAPNRSVDPYSDDVVTVDEAVAVAQAVLGSDVDIDGTLALQLSGPPESVQAVIQANSGPLCGWMRGERPTDPAYVIQVIDKVVSDEWGMPDQEFGASVRLIILLGADVMCRDLLEPLDLSSDIDITP